MRGKLWFIGGVAVGFVLGARAGREKYDELVLNARKVMDHPTVQEAAGVAQAQANRLYAEGRERLSHTRLGEKLNGHDHTADPSAHTDSLSSAGVTSGTAASGSTTGGGTTPRPGGANKADGTSKATGTGGTGS
ncbi:hypothetical protein O7623_11260 [Solwaraspora sp. WMMD791]|uniref:hypothetical protein n=1 Tax=Solwaraspora sp. WMMD791 TaxID=3016086 RepID=UPI00249BB71C|nr:hypothetical protein [Solwaraspora sp. WMMD791]WFE29721.1 hypothetical protein O7623_11260 [Solwaraspora sp. WMMD791]